jgi:hypothetical protein
MNIVVHLNVCTSVLNRVYIWIHIHKLCFHNVHEDGGLKISLYFVISGRENASLMAQGDLGLINTKTNLVTSQLKGPCTYLL